MLVATPYLSVSQPYRGVVYIPFECLSQRQHELPPPHRPIRLLHDGADVPLAEAWLRERGYQVQVVAPESVAIPALDANDSFRLWEPNPFLMEVLADWQVPPEPRRALDLACGSGREAVALADLGWHVVAVDRLPDALARGRDLQSRYTPQSHPIEWVCTHLERDAWEPMGWFACITLFYFFSRPVLARLWKWVASGGGVVIEAFTEQHRQRWGRPASEARVVRSGELPSLLPSEFAIRHYSEGTRENGRHTARLWAIRL